MEYSNKKIPLFTERGKCDELVFESNDSGSQLDATTQFAGETKSSACAQNWKRSRNSISKGRVLNSISRSNLLDATAGKIIKSGGETVRGKVDWVHYQSRHSHVIGHCT